MPSRVECSSAYCHAVSPDVILQLSISCMLLDCNLSCDLTQNETLRSCRSVCTFGYYQLNCNRGLQGHLESDAFPQISATFFSQLLLYTSVLPVNSNLDTLFMQEFQPLWPPPAQLQQSPSRPFGECVPPQTFVLFELLLDTSMIAVYIAT